MNSFKMFRIVVGATLAFSACAVLSPAQAEIYRWTGPDGQVHFGDRKPLEATATPAEPFVGKGAVSFIGMDRARKPGAGRTRALATQPDAQASPLNRAAMEEPEAGSSSKARAGFTKVAARTSPALLLNRLRPDAFEANLVNQTLAKTGR